MIRTKHRRWARVIFTPVIEGLLRTHFDHFYATGSLPETDPDGGLLVTPNHFSWWDGFFMFHLLFPMKRRQIHLMMLERQLKRYWYFRHIGAYSIDPGRPRTVGESIRYTAEVLDDPTRLAVVYPQGEIDTYGRRPLVLQKGIKSILSRTRDKVTVLPVYFRIEYYENRKPDIYFGYGRPVDKSLVLRDFEEFERIFNEGIEAFDALVDMRAYTVDCFKAGGKGQWKLN